MEKDTLLMNRDELIQVVWDFYNSGYNSNPVTFIDTETVKVDSSFLGRKTTTFSTSVICTLKDGEKITLSQEYVSSILARYYDKKGFETKKITLTGDICPVRDSKTWMLREIPYCTGVRGILKSKGVSSKQAGFQTSECKKSIPYSYRFQPSGLSSSNSEHASPDVIDTYYKALVKAGKRPGFAYHLARRATQPKSK